MVPSAVAQTRFMAAPGGVTHQQVRRTSWWTFPTLLSFTAGILTDIRFQFGGRASIGELILAVIAVFAVLANLANPSFWKRRMVLILSALCVSFFGYVLSDLINATPADRLARGWARMAFVIMDFIAIWALTRRNVTNLPVFCLGQTLSLVLSWDSAKNGFLYNYKFHLAIPITVAVMMAIPLILRRAAIKTTGFALIGVGMLHLRLDFRIMGGICMLVGFVLIARSMTASRFRSLYLALLSISLTLSSVSIGYLYSSTNLSYGVRREGSNSQRLSLALAGINAIERSPIFGLGSWVWDNAMWNVYAGRMGRGSAADLEGGEEQGPHSQLIQAWAEAGLLGLFFFVYFGRLLIEALWAQFFRRGISIMTPLFVLYLVDALWDLACSPFANLHRLNIALALVITLHIARGRRKGSAAECSGVTP